MDRRTAEEFLADVKDLSWKEFEKKYTVKGVAPEELEALKDQYSQMKTMLYVLKFMGKKKREEVITMIITDPRLTGLNL